MWEDDSLTQTFKDKGCVVCGEAGNSFYIVQYYILPSRLVRKRHRDKRRMVFYCSPCYDKDETFEFEVDGKSYSVPRKPQVDPMDRTCIVCDSRDIRPPGLYGTVSSTLQIGGSFFEDYVLAFLCSKCVEEYEVCL